MIFLAYVTPGFPQKMSTLSVQPFIGNMYKNVLFYYLDLCISVF